MVRHFTEIQERSLLVVIFSCAGITQIKFRDISQALITEVIVATPVEDRYAHIKPTFVPHEKGDQFTKRRLFSNLTLK
jgi:hypothetical protein